VARAPTAPAVVTRIKEQPQKQEVKVFEKKESVRISNTEPE
jgi:hypothetical protein